MIYSPKIANPIGLDRLGKEGIIPMERFGCKWLKRKKEPGSN